MVHALFSWWPWRPRGPRWMSVHTPDLFHEIRISDIEAPTERELREIQRMHALADLYGARVQTAKQRRPTR